jgi:uncharacterized protein YeaO (DUF488 family)
MMTPGTLNTIGIRQLMKYPRDDTTYINVARGDMTVVDYHMKNLAPSYPLLSYYLDHKNQGVEVWWNEYRRRFLQEMLKDEANKGLIEVAELLASGRNVTLVCFCTGDAFCHRSLVKDLVLLKLGDILAFDDFKVGGTDAE